MAFYIIIAILMFGVLIALHEFGHFITAKLLGVRINEFSIGMGPLLWSQKRGETQYSLRAIPMGGFCAMEGEDDDSDDPRAFSNKPAWKKFIILVAGSFMNFLTGLVLLILIFGQATAFVTPVIEDFMEGFPYESEAGLLPGDRIVSVNGEHNVSNALSAIAVADLLGVPFTKIKEGLKSFHGTDRRFEYKGEVNGVTVIDDYAHHPTEINATLTAAKEYPHKEIWCIFQPHTYTRTKALFPEFVDALTHADHVILADIYAARETDTLGMSSEMIAEELKKKGCDAYYFPSFEEIENFCLDKCQKGDVLITMGAGNVVNIGENLLKR